MNKKKNLLFISKLIYALEIVISATVILAIIFSFPDLFKYIIKIVNSEPNLSLNLFQEFLKHSLMLVIGMEFIIMLTAYSDKNIIYLITFVIARKLLIKSDTMMDLLIGAVAIAILFFVKNFIMKKNINVDVNAGIFSAATSVESINQQFNYHIDSHGFQSIGGLVYYLLQQAGSEIASGELISDQYYIYQIEKESNGTIELITIQPK